MTRKPPSRSPRDEHGSGRADEQPDHHAAGHQAIRPGASAGPSEGQSSEEGMYQVGYCRPPLHSRFKPGQSGNPKGRPRQSRNMRTIARIADRTATAEWLDRERRNYSGPAS